MASVGGNQVKPFVGPMVGQTITANDVRGNDNVLRERFNAHDADSTIHIQSGTLAARPATALPGTTFFATDTQYTYPWVGSACLQTGWAHWWGCIYDTTNQTLTAANTAQLVTFNTTDGVRGTDRVSGNGLRVDYAGSYNCQFSAQLTNPDSAEHDVWFWFAKNGTALADTAGRVTIQKKHGTVDGHALVSWNIFTTLAATDVVQMYWEATSTLVTLQTLAAASPRPSAPSIILTVNRI